MSKKEILWGSDQQGPASGRSSGVDVTMISLLLSIVGFVVAPVFANEQEEAHRDTVAHSQEVDVQDEVMKLMFEASSLVASKGAEKAVTCSGRTCSGTIYELFDSKITFGTGSAAYVRFVLKNGPLKDAVLAYGCVETWSLYLDTAGNEELLTELRTADVLKSRIALIFGARHSGASETLDKCEIEWIYRYPLP